MHNLSNYNFKNKNKKFIQWNNKSNIKTIMIQKYAFVNIISIRIIERWKKFEREREKN